MFPVPSRRRSVPRRRAYRDEFLSYGFVPLLRDGIEVPQCVVCMATLCSESLKPSKLKNHLVKIHPELAEERPEYFMLKASELKRKRMDMGERAEDNRDRKPLHQPPSGPCVYIADTVSRVGLLHGFLIGDEDRGRFSDARVSCEGEEIVGVHRAVLAAGSPVLREAMKHTDVLQEDTVTIVMPDFSKSEVLNVAKLFYGDPEDVASQISESLLISLGIIESPTSSSSTASTTTQRNKRRQGSSNFMVKIKQEAAYMSDEDDVYRLDHPPESPTGDFGFGPGDEEEEEDSASPKPRKRARKAEKPKKTPNKNVPVKSEEPPPGFECAGCNVVFDDVDTLRMHLREDAEDLCPRGRETTWVCSQCDEVLYERERFRLHEMTHTGQFDCEDCDKTFSDRGKYLVHISGVHKKSEFKEYPCPKCNKSFEYVKNLLNHLKEHEKPVLEKFQCGICFEKFNNKVSHWYHKQKHLFPTGYKCEKCPRSFKSMKGLKYHTKLHDGIADFLCDDCGRGFVTRQKLLDHRRAKHTFERPYICDQCGESFIRTDNLNIHKRRVHTGERPYACEHCDWRGVDSSSLIHHRKKHEPRIKMPVTANL